MSHSLLLRAVDQASDAELVSRALSGDRWGREMLYRRHAGRLLALATRLLADRGDAEEVVQDTFVTGFAQLATLREPGAVGGRLGQIAVSLVRRRIRRARLLRRLGLDRGADDATLESLGDPGITPEERTELALVDRALAGTSASSREPEQEQALARIWSRIDQIDAELPAGARRPSSKVRRLDRATMAGGVLAMAAAVIIGVAVARHDGGPLRLSDGHAIVAFEAPAEGATLSMSDGSLIALSGGARFEPLVSTGTAFVGMLQNGRADFEVRPGGPRRWQIECGLATVEVGGAGFSCEREPGRLRVAVSHGVVLVRGEQVRDRAQRLVAGESLEISDAGGPPAGGVRPRPDE
ncbi:MAG TPA: FecR domain-containing protein [Polyangia bacterium]|nr:FecR domain-containing protein [Polyangia bacterium]